MDGFSEPVESAIQKNIRKEFIRKEIKRSNSIDRYSEHFTSPSIFYLFVVDILIEQSPNACHSYILIKSMALRKTRSFVKFSNNCITNSISLFSSLSKKKIGCRTRRKIQALPSFQLVIAAATPSPSSSRRRRKHEEDERVGRKYINKIFLALSLPPSSSSFAMSIETKIVLLVGLRVALSLSLFFSLCGRSIYLYSR